MPVNTPQKRLMRDGLQGFQGVNLRRDTLSLADEDMARAINADLHTFPGVILVRRGRTLQFSTALGSGIEAVRALATYDSTRRYQVVGTTLYRNQTAVSGVTLSNNAVTTFAHVRPLLDTATWTFVADDLVMRKDNGTTNVRWGITAPTTAPTVRPTSGGQLTAGAYTVVYTYVRKVGDSIAHESNPSPASSTITLSGANTAIAVEAFTRATDAQVTHLRFYRTLVGGSVRFFATEISNTAGTVQYGITQAWENNSSNLNGAGTQFTQESTHTLGGSNNQAITVTYDWELDHNAGLERALHRTATGLVSSTPAETQSTVFLRDPDTALGSAVETDNDPPPLASWVTTFQEHTFLCRDASNPHYLWYSKRFRPEAIPAENFLEIGDPSDPLQCAVPLVGFLGVFTRRTKFRVLGNDTSGFVAIEALNTRGTPAAQAVLATELGVVFPARDGVFVTNFVSPDQELSQLIEPLFHGETVHDYAPIDWDKANEMRMAYWKGRIYWGYVDTDGTRMLAVYSRDTAKWYFYEQPVTALLVEEDMDQLTMGDTSGLVSVLEDATVQTDAGTDIAWEVWLAERSFTDPFTRKLFQYVHVDMDCQGETVTGQLYLDGTLAHTFSVTGSRTRTLTRLPAGLLGRIWQLRLTYTGDQRVALYRADVLALPLQTS